MIRPAHLPHADRGPTGRPSWPGRRRARGGFEFWEMGLFVFFLAIAGGASIFFFFLSSRDMKAAQAQAATLQRIEQILDLIGRDLENAVTLSEPFTGAGKECFFRRATPSGSLPPSLVEEGFVFRDNALLHVVRDAAGVPLARPLGDLDNPLIAGLQAGSFERLGPGLLQISLKIALPTDPEASRVFTRTIFLRNL
ncbi:MAG: hypothetical protein OZSIB_2111 [Candidatus Ozemobacter sibiricus]|jgi:hypothetical protein|uniref:Uncharacterized protein n=1 Tax=Candidatus Ozemobacter sibiricus TaxID=2268124 RepID=A0A367ZV61_9BACT|nr:MAG: hypothetical protein OZSIB_2111 [Candidatus Ozemobacter sibiricus]